MRLITFFLLLALPLSGQQAPPKPLAERVADTAAASRLPLAFDGRNFSGPAWKRLLDEGREAQFFLIGEEHGIAENAKLAAALFEGLQPAGYSKIVIEVSPAVARRLDTAARGGVDGLRELYASPGGEPAFFGMKEEAEFLAAARAAAGGPHPLFWGVDYEVAGDRLLIAMLEAKEKPAAAKSALAALRSASTESWTQYEATKNPQFIYSFAGDPALVRAVRDAWPAPDAESAQILETLEETFEINRHWVARQGWRSNERRSELIRRNFIRHWQNEKTKPRVLAKLGASHLMRGRNITETWDLGSLLPEIAALEGRKAFHLLVLPGTESNTAVFDPTKWRYQPAPAKDRYGKGLEPILAAAFPDAFTLIDLRPLRPVVANSRDASPELLRTVFGFDAVLVMSGSTPSANLLR